MNLREFLHSEHTKKSHFVLLGNPVKHSFSPLMHNTAARHYDLKVRYYAIQLEKQEMDLVPEFLDKEQLKGVNLTIPFKYNFLQFTDELDPVSKKIEATNALVKNETGWKGYNTDVYGFSVPLKDYKQKLAEKAAIIFGSGGAAKAVAYALKELGIREVIVVSRTPGNAGEAVRQLADKLVSYQEWSSFTQNVALFVNATPLGMKPHLKKSLVKETETHFLKNTICYDLIYNPSETKFLKQAKEAGAQTINGLDMLVHQGSKLFKLWTGKTFPIRLIKEALSNKIDAKN